MTGNFCVYCGYLALLAICLPRELPEPESGGARGGIIPGNVLSLGTAWSQGFLEGGMLALLPIYLLAAGLSEAAVSWLMSGLMIGIIVAQVPVAWLADRLGRTAVLVGCEKPTAPASVPR